MVRINRQPGRFASWRFSQTRGNTIYVVLTLLANPMPRTKAPNSIDMHVGKRVRMRRLMFKMSQTKLGDALGITFQQVQKYEKGRNRIGASRLQHISQILQVPAAFFFEGAPNPPEAHSSTSATASPDTFMDLMSTSEGLALAKAFMRIANMKLRRRIVDLVEEIVGRTTLIAPELYYGAITQRSAFTGSVLEAASNVSRSIGSIGVPK
jgi:transcriptional regulator with XRE-family HTH domain